jgi:2-keto-4-pentenoate hydratase
MPADPEARARMLLSALHDRRQVAPLSDDDPDFDLAAAYEVSAAVTELRIARGETPAGWKIGFTNRTIWDEYGVHAPIWGPVYDSTLTHVRAPAELDISTLVEPRIEPEIMFRFAKPPQAGMSESELVTCLDGVAHGFEIVQSLFPRWRFRAADTVAAFGLHGALAVGPFTPMPGWRMPIEWRRLLENFTVTLYRDGVEIDRGQAGNVLGGPLSALRHLVEGFGSDAATRIKPGMIVTTGTVTRAFPVKPGERWTTTVEGLVVAEMDVTLTGSLAFD